MATARLRFASLWISQETRILSEWALRITVWLEVARQSVSGSNSAWHLTTAIFIAPFVILAPLHGAVSNALPRRWVLVGSAVLALAALLPFVPSHGPWLWAMGLSAIGAALYSPTRFAMLPAVAVDTRMPLARISGWIETGVAVAIVGGILLGLTPWQGPWLGQSPIILVILALSVVCVLTAIPAHFPSDPRRAEMPLVALRGFFTDCRRIAADRPARYSLLALAFFQGLVTAGSGALVTQTLGDTLQPGPQSMESLVLVCVGVAVGCLVASAQGNPRRILGLVPFGITGLVVAQGWLALSMSTPVGTIPLVACLLLGFMAGLVNVPLRASYLAAVPADARGNAMSVMNTAIYVLTTLVALGMLVLTRTQILPSPFAQLVFLSMVAAGAAILAWWILLAPALEQIIEIIIWPMYRIHGHGPGVATIPLRGPLILIGNHTTYFDPFLIGKLVPRSLVPMMTSKFYDLPVVRWLMVNVVGTIRVEVGKYRREAPELQQAIAVLKQGGCLLLYPEAILRRKEEIPLRQFGQGVWHILNALPETPVVIFWVEGGWGSWASYKDGPPFKNKKMDRWRTIDIAITQPQVLDPAILAHHRTTRNYLMQACLEARRLLGLEVHSLGAGQDREEQEEEAVCEP